MCSVSRRSGFSCLAHHDDSTTARELTVNRRAPGGSLSQIEPLSASTDATLTTPLLPGFSLSLAKLFA